MTNTAIAIVPTVPLVSQSIKGLYIASNYLTTAVQNELLQLIATNTNIQCGNNHSIIDSSNEVNQYMHFGELSWLNPLLDTIERYLLINYTSNNNNNTTNNSNNNNNWLLREPLFNQFLINYYSPGTGIKSHIDLAKFDNGIITLSLLSSCTIKFTCISTNTVVNYRLNPGDLLLMTDESRYQWKHEIVELLPNNSNSNNNSNNSNNNNNNSNNNSTNHHINCPHLPNYLDRINSNPCLCLNPRLSLTCRSILTDSTTGLCIIQRDLSNNSNNTDSTSTDIGRSIDEFNY